VQVKGLPRTISPLTDLNAQNRYLPKKGGAGSFLHKPARVRGRYTAPHPRVSGPHISTDSFASNDRPAPKKRLYQFPIAIHEMSSIIRPHPFAMDNKTLIHPDAALKILTWCTRSALEWGEHGTADLTRVRVHGQLFYVRQECEALRDRTFTHGLEPQTRKAASGR
jgi:hypothetical protein